MQYNSLTTGEGWTGRHPRTTQLAERGDRARWLRDDAICYP